MSNLKISFLFKQSSITKLILSVIFLISLGIFLKTLLLDYYPDFNIYYYGAQSILHGGNPYMGDKNLFGVFLYPPFALLFFLPLSLFPFFVAEKFFVVTSLFCFFISVFLLFKLLKIGISSNQSLILGILLLNFFPEKFTLGMGQINNVILLLFTLFIVSYVKKINYVAGISLALAIALKISPALVLVFLIINRKWNILIVTFFSLVIMSTLVFVFINPNIVLYFVYKTLPNLAASVKVDYYNQALSGFLQRQIQSPFIREYTKLLLDLILFFSTTFFALLYGTKDKYKMLLSFGAFITVGLIINTFSWQHHFVWLIIPYVVTFSYLLNNSFSKLYFILLFVSFILVAINLKDPNLYPLFFQSHVLYGSIILLSLDLYLIFKVNKLNVKHSKK